MTLLRRQKGTQFIDFLGYMESFSWHSHLNSRLMGESVDSSVPDGRCGDWLRWIWFDSECHLCYKKKPLLQQFYHISRCHKNEEAVSFRIHLHCLGLIGTAQLSYYLIRHWRCGISREEKDNCINIEEDRKRDCFFLILCRIQVPLPK